MSGGILSLSLALLLFLAPDMLFLIMGCVGGGLVVFRLWPWRPLSNICGDRFSPGFSLPGPDFLLEPALELELGLASSGVLTVEFALELGLGLELELGVGLGLLVFPGWSLGWFFWAGAGAGVAVLAG